MPPSVARDLTDACQHIVRCSVLWILCFISVIIAWQEGASLAFGPCYQIWDDISIYSWARQWAVWSISWGRSLLYSYPSGDGFNSIFPTAYRNTTQVISTCEWSPRHIRLSCIMFHVSGGHDQVLGSIYIRWRVFFYPLSQEYAKSYFGFADAIIFRAWWTQR